MVGSPSRIGRLQGGQQLWTYKDQGIRVVVAGEKVQGILITTGDFITAEGVKMSSSTNDVVRSFGPHGVRKGRGLFLRERGIGFILERDTVVEIQVLYPRATKSQGGG